MPKGLNLIILEIVENDITDNVELICPTNLYSTNLYNIKKNTLILIKKDSIYEPIYLYFDKQTSIIITKTFNESNKSLLPNIKRVLTTIGNIIKK